MPTASPRLRRLLTPLLFPLALLLVLLEATVWRLLEALGRALGRLSVFAALERLVARLSPNAVVAVFVLPFVPLIPVLKVSEMWLLMHHHYVAAVLLIIGGKVVGAAFATRVYAIALPKMLQVRWFARAHAWVQRLLALGHALIERLPMLAALRRTLHGAMDAVRDAMVALRRALRGGGPGLGRRFLAARRYARRARQG